MRPKLWFMWHNKLLWGVWANRESEPRSPTKEDVHSAKSVNNWIFEIVEEVNIIMELARKTWQMPWNFERSPLDGCYVSYRKTINSIIWSFLATVRTIPARGRRVFGYNYNLWKNLDAPLHIRVKISQHGVKEEGREGACEGQGEIVRGSGNSFFYRKV